jgi:dTDP-4-dehydrorhamnose 3,5-epimerase-like enzyme
MTAPTAHCRLIDLPKIPDARGNLTFIEGGEHVPFAIRRVYWIYDVPGGERRGGHAYRTLEEFFVALSGSFDVVVDDGRGDVRHVVLNRSYFGLYVPPMTWRHLESFSTNAVCLILASQPYDEADYLRDHAEFTSARAGA